MGELCSTRVPVLNPTPRERMLDRQGRPYFLWDADMTLQRFEELLRSGTRAERLYLLAKVMRQAKPDDVLTFVCPEEIAAAWPDLQSDLGTTRQFWHWLLRTWRLLP